MIETGRVSIAGRALPEDLATVATYFHKAGSTPESKSDLVFIAFLHLAGIIRQTAPESAVEGSHEALPALEALGLTWDDERGTKDWVKSLQIDAFRDLTADQMKELRSAAENIRKRDLDEMKETGGITDDEILQELGGEDE